MIGESRRDRLRRILKKLLSDRREVAVPVAVPILPTVPGQEVAQLPVWSSSDKYFSLASLSPLFKAIESQFSEIPDLRIIN